MAAPIVAFSWLVAYASGLWGADRLAVLNPALGGIGVADMALKWDGAIYASMATHGYVWDYTYNAPITTAFFPLYPFLIAVLSGVLRWIAPGFDWGDASHGSHVAAGLIISAACFYFSLVLLIRLLAPRTGLPGAALVAVGLALLPTSFFLTGLYTESLFLMLMLLAFTFARSRLTAKWLCAGLLGMLAALTRSAGVLLFAALLVEYLAQRGWQWRKVRVDVLCLGLIPAGTAIYMAFLWWRFGDPLLVSKIQSVAPWNRHGGLFWETYYNGLVTWWTSVTGGFGPRLDPILNVGQGRRLWFALDLALPAIMLVGAWVARKKLFASEWAWLLMGILFPLSTGSTQSLNRFSLMLWPGLVWLGTVGRWGKWVAIPLLLASLALMARFSAEFAMGKWVA
jgi:hypothetical protein